MSEGLTEAYSSPLDFPELLPLFPLRGAIILPRASLTLNVFEPRYLELVEYCLGHGRILGVIQPAPEAGEEESPHGKGVPLRSTGCAGRITAFSEMEDDRLLITMTGIARFHLGEEVNSDHGFRLCRPVFNGFEGDFKPGQGEDEVDRPLLIATLRNYLEANNLHADWDRINSASNERLVNTLSVLSPYGPEEKQALLEAADLKDRSHALITLAQFELASPDDDSGTSLQ